MQVDLAALLAGSMTPEAIASEAEHLLETPIYKMYLRAGAPYGPTSDGLQRWLAEKHQRAQEAVQAATEAATGTDRIAEPPPAAPPSSNLWPSFAEGHSVRSFAEGQTLRSFAEGHTVRSFADGHTARGFADG
jgi:hypothetical protein